MQERGLRVLSPDGDFEVRPKVTGDLLTIGRADVVFLGVKAHGLTALAPALQPLFGPDTEVVSTQNGIPWWYFQRHRGPYEGTPVHSTDPDGAIARLIDPGRIIGAVVYPAANLVAPGVVQVVEGKRFSLGELDGSTTPRVQRLSASLTAAGFKAPVTDDIRGEIWLKLLGNLSFNPISALSRATLADLLGFPPTRELSMAMMREAEAIAGRLGVTLRVGLDKRIAGAEKVGAHKTSMLQDLEAGKPLELEALVGAVAELGRLTGTPTPHLDAVYACTALLAKMLAEASGEPGVTR
jgi:2-dehydropantoate 2-reductase